MSNWLTSPVAPWWVNVLERILWVIAGAVWPAISHLQHRRTKDDVEQIKRAVNGHGNGKDHA